MRSILLILLLSLTYVTEAQSFIPWDLHPNYDEATQVAIGSDNDCSVIAFAIAANVPYHVSFNTHKKFFHRLDPKEPTRTDYFWLNVGRALTSQYRVGIMLHTPDSTTTTVSELVREYDDEFLYIAVDGHALAAVNGVIYDNRVRPCLDCEVHAAFAVQRMPPCDDYRFD